MRLEMVKPSTYENIIRAAAQAHKDGRKGDVKNILFDADSAVDLMTGAKVKIPAKAKAMHDKLNKMYPAKPW
jgi:hypothetical protein